MFLNLRLSLSVLILLFTGFALPCPETATPSRDQLVLKINGQSLVFDSLENGLVKLKRPDGAIVSEKLTMLPANELKRVMEFTGWGRVWEFKDRQTYTIADLVQVVETAVVLELVDGSKKVVEIDTLSRIDKAYVEARRGLTAESLPATFKAKVIGVHDGETVTVLLNRRQYKVRIAGINAPETGQAFGTKAKTHLKNLIQEKLVTGVREDTDQYGRNVCTLEVDGKRVDYNMLENGLAWHYVQFSQNSQRKILENEARAKQLNLWSEANPVPPWQWRQWGDPQRKKWAAQSQKMTQPDSATDHDTAVTNYWMSSNSGVRHNRSCRWYKNSKGHYCESDDGKPCKQCGG